MGIDAIHGDLEYRLPEYEMIDDIISGERAIKEAGERYLPALKGQTNSDYSSYKSRGKFFNATGRTLQGLMGGLFRKPVDVKLPPSVDALRSSIMSTGQDDLTLYRKVAASILKYGRAGLLVDSLEKNSPYIALYKPQHITNWRTEFIDGREVLTLLVLQETIEEPKADDPFKLVCVGSFRVFRLLENQVEVTVWKADEDGNYIQIDEKFPKIKGRALDRIPFIFIGADSNTSEVNKPPLLDMAYVNINHWRLSVDYNHGLHFCALPTPWRAGFDSSEEQVGIGPLQLWEASDYNAKCGYLEFTGQGLVSVSKAMSEDKEDMAVLGARIIEQTRSRVETAEAARIRQSGESGTLIGISNNISDGLTEAMKLVARWIGASEELYVKLSTDFVDSKMEPQEITALLSTLQSGSISLDTFLWNLQQGELLPPDRDIEDEKLKIEAEGNRSFTSGNMGNTE